jgi:predicted DNA-binding transcriptional regulator AlpA
MPESNEKTPSEAGRGDQGEKDFSKIEMLVEATGGLSLSQVCAVTGLERSTIQNWVKRGWVAHPKNKKYEQTHIARILIINALKECIKLEHIAVLVDYVCGSAQAGQRAARADAGAPDGDAGAAQGGGGVIKESSLYVYLRSALETLGHSDDFSRSGIESVVNTVISKNEPPPPESIVKIRKALTVMVFACVCTDVKRRTEVMMERIIDEIENPDAVLEDAPEPTETANEAPAGAGVANAEEDIAAEARKTVAQTIREWDLGEMESIISDEAGQSSSEDAAAEQAAAQAAENAAKAARRPWYSRRNT